MVEIENAWEWVRNKDAHKPIELWKGYSDRNKLVGVYLTKRLLENIDEYCGLIGVHSRSKFIRAVLERELYEEQHFLEIVPDGENFEREVVDE